MKHSVYIDGVKYVPEVETIPTSGAELQGALMAAVALLEHAKCFYNGPHSAEFDILPALKKLSEKK